MHTLMTMPVTTFVVYILLENVKIIIVYQYESLIKCIYLFAQHIHFNIKWYQCFKGYSYFQIEPTHGYPRSLLTILVHNYFKFKSIRHDKFSFNKHTIMIYNDCFSLNKIVTSTTATLSKVAVVTYILYYKIRLRKNKQN